MRDPVEWFFGALTIACLAAHGWFLCVAWSASSVTHGEVISKDHQASWTQVQLIQCGQVMTTTVTVWPETWSISVAGTNAAGKAKVRNVSIAETAWSTTRIGDQWKE